MILFLAKNCQTTTKFSGNGIFWYKFPVFEKIIHHKATENLFVGDRVAKFMLPSYNFQSF
jgi:hypothetical protein